MNTSEWATWTLTAFTGVLAVSTMAYTCATHRLYRSSNRQSVVLEKQVKVTIAQLKIAALQADISAEEMDSLKKTVGSRDEYVAKIREIGSEMQRLIGELE